MTIFVQITGRLGNHLFQIALGYSLAKKTGQQFVMVYNKYNKYEQQWIDYFLTKSKSTIELNFIERQTIPKNTVYYSEKRNGINCFEFHPELEQLCTNGNVFFDGYFQTEQYFKEYFIDLKKLFLRNEIKVTDGYFIHVRRCDYLNHPVYEIKYEEYFIKAIQYFPKNALFYVVSDDIPWCKQNNLFKEFSFIEIDTIDTLHFMAGCKGGICANSSFSWWGAWLSKREIVTMPKQWINNGMNTEGIYFENVIVI